VLQPGAHKTVKKHNNNNNNGQIAISQQQFVSGFGLATNDCDSCAAFLFETGLSGRVPGLGLCGRG